MELSASWPSLITSMDVGARREGTSLFAATSASCSRRFSSMSRHRRRLPSMSMNFAWGTSITGRRHLYLSVGTSEIE